MANWQTTINFSSFWDDEDMPIQDKGKAAAKILHKKVEELKSHPLFDEDALNELENLADEFELINDEYDAYSGVDEFDNILDSLYDWGDYPLDDNWGIHAKKRAWIKTF